MKTHFSTARSAASAWKSRPESGQQWSGGTSTTRQDVSIHKAGQAHTYTHSSLYNLLQNIQSLFKIEPIKPGQDMCRKASVLVCEEGVPELSLNSLKCNFNIFQQNISTKYFCISEFVKGTNLVASLRWTLGPHASGCYGSARMWQRLGTGDLGRAGGIAVILPIFPIFFVISQIYPDFSLVFSVLFVFFVILSFLGKLSFSPCHFARTDSSKGTSCQTGLMLFHFKPADCQVAEAFLESAENLFWFVFRCLGGSACAV